MNLQVRSDSSPVFVRFVFFSYSICLDRLCRSYPHNMLMRFLVNCLLNRSASVSHTQTKTWWPRIFLIAFSKPMKTCSSILNCAKGEPLLKMLIANVAKMRGICRVLWSCISPSSSITSRGIGEVLYKLNNSRKQQNVRIHRRARTTGCFF